MSMFDQITGAMAADPVAKYAIVAAGVVILYNILMRRGGASAASIIRIFGGAATAATVVKVVLWLLQVGKADPPSGTDIILVIGAMLACLYVVIEDVRITVTDDENTEEPSLFQSILARLKRFWPRKHEGDHARQARLADEGEPAEETPGARREREAIENRNRGEGEM